MKSFPPKSFIQAAGLLLLGGLAAVPRAQQTCTPNFLLETFNNPAPETADAMGYSVAISGNLIVAGAPYDSPGGNSNAGSAYVFDGTTGGLVATLNNPDPTVDDNFGWSVAIEGNIAVVGAWKDDPPAPVAAGAGIGSGLIPVVNNAGAVYLFDATTGALLRTLTKPVPAQNDAFGHAVAISGGRVIVGAPQEAQFTGAAYIFDAATGNLTATLTKPSPATAEVFGWAVDLDGDLAAVGAYLVNVDGKLRVGEAYVFNAATGALVSTLHDPEPDQDDYFAMSVAISGNTVLAGAYDKTTGGIRTGGMAYIFDASTGAYLRTFTAANAEIDSQFDNSVAIEGNIGVIGGYGYTRQITIFDVSTATALGTIDPPAIWYSEGGFFGDAVAISGGLIATGSHQEDLNNAGRAYLYSCPPPPTATPTDTPSPTASPSPTVTPIRTPSPIPTATPIPCAPDTLLQTLNAPVPTEGDYFGNAVAISGSTAIIGSYSHALGVPVGAAAGGGLYGAGIAYLVNAETGGLIATLNNPAPAPGDYFGYSVAIDGGYAVVGANYDLLDVETRTGTAYVFYTENGLLQSILNDPTPAGGDQFGASVGISGDLVVVGAHGASEGELIYQSGEAYIFDAPSGALLATLHNPAPEVTDQFGYSVAISGTLAVVGAPYDDPGAIGASGSAYIFDATTGALVATLNNPTPVTGDYFGWSVAIYGNRAVVGAFGDSPGGASYAGSAYVFDATTGDLVTTLNTAAPVANDQFGWAVGIFGNTAVVGASIYGVGELTGANGGAAVPLTALPLNGEGAAYVFDATTGALKATLANPDPAAYDLFGNSVAISGNIALAGAPQDSPDVLQYAVGRAYSFTCIPSEPTPTPTPIATPTPAPCVPGTPLQTIPNPEPAEYDTFGQAVALSGNVVLVGVREDDPLGVTQAGSAYTFDATTGALIATLNNPAPAAYDWFGESVAISGNLALVGARGDDPNDIPDAGAAYVFNATTGALVATLNKAVPVPNGIFGTAVALDGNVAVVGVWADDVGGITRAGKAYVFNATTGELAATLVNPEPAAYDTFGISVAVSGNLAVVGAFYDAPGGGFQVGSAYVFNATTGSLVSTLNNPVPMPGDQFGEAVSISGNIAVVGAGFADPSGVTSAGAAYAFDATTGAHLATFTNPEPTENDRFGRTVAVSGPTALIGAAFDSPGGINAAGTAYLFDATNGSLAATLNDPQPELGDSFGGAVAISGSRALVAAYGDNPGGVENAGSVYTFACGDVFPSPTPTPTLTPSSTPTPIGTPIISFDIVIGYHPANDHGRGHVDFTDSDPSPDLRSYVIEFRRTNRFGIIFQQAFSLDGPPAAVESRSAEFDLPLNVAGNPLSYEADLQYRVVGYTGQNGTGIGLYQSPLAYAKHPSATLDSSVTLTAPPIAPGSEPFSMSDARPTAQIGTLQYDIVRTVPGGGGETVLATLDHGYPGPADVAKVWPAVVRTGALAVVAGPQLLTIHARHDYFDSAGAPLGRYDVAPPSPPLALGDIGALSARIAEYLRTGAGDTAGLDLNADGVVDVGDLLVGLATGQ